MGSASTACSSRGAALRQSFFSCSLAAPAAAQRAPASQYVDLALVLAVDASGSVDRVRFELQKQGYVAAFRHPRVLQAIQSGPTQSIAVIMMQWTGPALQVIAVPWTQDFRRGLGQCLRRQDRGGAARAVRRRHLDLGRDRHRDGAAVRQSVIRRRGA